METKTVRYGTENDGPKTVEVAAAVAEQVASDLDGVVLESDGAWKSEDAAGDGTSPYLELGETEANFLALAQQRDYQRAQAMARATEVVRTGNDPFKGQHVG